MNDSILIDEDLVGEGLKVSPDGKCTLTISYDIKTSDSGYTCGREEVMVVGEKKAMRWWLRHNPGENERDWKDTLREAKREAKEWVKEQRQERSRALCSLNP